MIYWYSTSRIWEVFIIALTEAQKRATKKYNEKNKEQKYYNSCKATCKLFITTKGKKEDLQEMYYLLRNKLDVANKEV